MKDSLKVAGVTFANDNGEKRQDILANIGIGWKTARLKQTVFDGERAVEVRIGSKMIGYVAKNQLSNELSHETELTCFIGVCKHKYYAVLMPREIPTGKEYAYMKKLCLESKTAMPAYDRRAYAVYFSSLRKTDSTAVNEIAAASAN